MSKILVMSCGDKDFICCAKHLVGSGAVTNFTEVYCLRDNRFLGRFEVQTIPTFDAKWDAGEHNCPATEAEIASFRKVRMLLLTMVDKVWK